VAGRSLLQCNEVRLTGAHYLKQRGEPLLPQKLPEPHVPGQQSEAVARYVRLKPGGHPATAGNIEAKGIKFLNKPAPPYLMNPKGGSTATLTGRALIRPSRKDTLRSSLQSS
jgi:hypothetical protein